MDRFKCELSPVVEFEDAPFRYTTLAVYTDHIGMNTIHWTGLEEGTSNASVAALFRRAKTAGYTFSHEMHAKAVDLFRRQLHINAYAHGSIDSENQYAENPYPVNDWSNRAHYWLLGFRQAPRTGFDDLFDPSIKDILSDSIMGLLQ